MKKVLLSIFAVAALASCFQNEDIVSTSDNNAIKFDSYVGNTTKAIDPSLTKATLQSFQVWGTTQGDHKLDNGDAAAIVPIFTDLKVSKNDAGAWRYNEDSTAYWIPGNTYNFAAVVNANVRDDKTIVTLGANGLPEKIYYNLPSLGNYDDRDLLYAEVKGIPGEDKGNGTDGKVAFAFDHLLSKAVFTFTNNSAEPSKNIYVVRDIVIGCVWDGIYTVSSKTWEAGGTTMTIKFGNIVANDQQAEASPILSTPLKSQYQRLLIPVANQDIFIECKIELYLNGEVKPENLADKINYFHKPTLNLQPGFSYNFALSAGLNDKIEFEVTKVEGWTENHPTLEQPNHDNPNIPDQNN